jgi:hypothetical protein
MYSKFSLGSEAVLWSYCTNWSNKLKYIQFQIPYRKTKYFDVLHIQTCDNYIKDNYQIKDWCLAEKIEFNECEKPKIINKLAHPVFIYHCYHAYILLLCVYKNKWIPDE